MLAVYIDHLPTIIFDILYTSWWLILQEATVEGTGLLNNK